jgi:enamine deaminase RidA (YjgF/YER057c/UK114 family)
MKKTLIRSDKVHKEVSKYSHGYIVEGASKTVVISGQVPVDVDGNIAPRGDFEKHVRQAFENLRNQLAVAGATFKDIVYLGVLLTDQSQWQPFDKIRGDYLEEPYPATTLIVVKSLAHQDWMCEIEAIAAL